MSHCEHRGTYVYAQKNICSLKCNGKKSSRALCVRHVGVPVGALLWDASMTTKTPVPTHTCLVTLNSDYIITQIVIKGEHFLTRVRTGHKGKLALIFMSVQILQGADHLTAL